MSAYSLSYPQCFMRNTRFNGDVASYTDAPSLLAEVGSQLGDSIHSNREVAYAAIVLDAEEKIVAALDPPNESKLHLSENDVLVHALAGEEITTEESGLMLLNELNVGHVSLDQLKVLANCPYGPTLFRHVYDTVAALSTIDEVSVADYLATKHVLLGTPEQIAWDRVFASGGHDYEQFHPNEECRKQFHEKFAEVSLATIYDCISAMHPGDNTRRPWYWGAKNHLLFQCMFHKNKRELMFASPTEFEGLLSRVDASMEGHSSRKSQGREALEMAIFRFVSEIEEADLQAAFFMQILLTQGGITHEARQKAMKHIALDTQLQNNLQSGFARVESDGVDLVGRFAEERRTLATMLLKALHSALDAHDDRESCFDALDGALTTVQEGLNRLQQIKGSGKLGTSTIRAFEHFAKVLAVDNDKRSVFLEGADGSAKHMCNLVGSIEDLETEASTTEASAVLRILVENGLVDEELES